MLKSTDSFWPKQGSFVLVEVRKQSWVLEGVDQSFAKQVALHIKADGIFSCPLEQKRLIRGTTNLDLSTEKNKLCPTKGKMYFFAKSEASM